MCIFVELKKRQKEKEIRKGNTKDAQFKISVSLWTQETIVTWDIERREKSEIGFVVKFLPDSGKL